MFSVKDKYIILLLITIPVVVFFPTFFNDFQTGWDDQWQVLDYEFVHYHSWEDLMYHFTHFHLGQYFPVNTILYIGVYELFGFNAGAFHTACLIVHICNVLLTFLVIRKIVCKVKSNWTVRRVNTMTAFTALIFAIHPLQVESVAWISASKIVLYTFFFLLGVWFYLNYLKFYTAWWLIGVAVCYLLAFGTKEQAIIFPLNLLALDYAFSRFQNLKCSLGSLKSRVIIEKLPFFLMVLMLYGFSLSNNLGSFGIDTYPLYQRLMFGMSSTMEYLFRFIVPVKLYYFYFFPIEIGEDLPVYYWGYPVLILICAAFIRHNYKRNNRLAVLGCLLFIINILLVLHIVPMPRKMITADRYMYFSIIGVGLLVTWIGYFFYIRRRVWRKVFISVFAIWLFFLAVQSFVRTMEWRDSDSVKQNVNELIERRKVKNKPVVDNPLKNEPYGKE